MNADTKRVMTALTALLAVSASTHAQEISTSLPLTSVGDKLLWTVGDQNLKLEVPLAGRVRLELYSPRVDQQDYRSDTYYGDEQYDAGVSQVSTTFTLVNGDGQEVLTQTFTPGAHGWETLLDQDLPAGTYQLKAVTQGNGKNTFAVRLAGVSAAISAELLTVNVHSRDWVPALNVTTDGAGYALKMYDGDGPQELQARVRDGQGNIYPLTVSADLADVELALPETAGNYVVELRQPETAQQFSNTVAFRLVRQGETTPIAISKVDQTGLLKVTAELLLPDGPVPTSAEITVGQTPVKVSGTLEERVKADTYTVSAAAIPGADVQVTPSVQVPRGGSGEVKVQVRPQVNLTLQSDKPEVCVGDTVTLTATASTAYAAELPLNLNLNAPGLQVQGDTQLQGSLTAEQPGVLRVTGTATQPGTMNISVQLGPWGQTQNVQVNVRPDATNLQLSRAPLNAAQVGDEVTVSLTVTNTAAAPVPYLLTDTPGSGLQALESTEFSGTLAAGETKTLQYRARVTQSGSATLQAELLAEGCNAVQTSAATLDAQVLPVATPKAPPTQSRLSSVSLPFDAPAQAREVVIAQQLPDGASIAPGSSRLNGQVLPDPQRGPSGTLYWVIPTESSQPGVTRGTVTYDLSHAGALDALPAPSMLVHLDADRSELLEGQIDLQDLAAARPLTTSATPTGNSGAIKFPLNGSEIRIRDRISVVVEVPAGETQELLLNGQPVSDDRLGESASDPVRGVTRLTYVGVPLQPGQNTLKVGNDTVQVQLVGATKTIEVKPTALIADGSTPLRVNLRTLDAHGKLTAQPTVTVRSNLEPRTPDGSGGESGYQVKLVNGEGILELQPQARPTTLKLDVLRGDQIDTYTFDVRSDRHRVGVGMVSATLGLSGDFNLQDDLTWQARASYEGPLLGGKLYIAADKDGLPTDRDTLKRFAQFGDSSVESVPLQGIDPVAAEYDHPLLHAQYRQSSLPISVLPVGEQLTALSANSKTNPQLSGFVAWVPEGRISEERLTPNGTRVLHLANPSIAPGSDTLELVTLERGTGKELNRIKLERNADYQLDLKTGVVTLARALDRLDAQFNDLIILASYRLESALSQRQLAYGAQLQHTGKTYSVGVAAISLDDQVTYGARATFDNGTQRADGLLAYSGGVQASAEFGTKLGDTTNLQARVRYQDAQYHGLAPFTVGLNASASLDTHLSRTLSAKLDAEYHTTPSSTTPTQGGSVTARADYNLNPFSVGAGLKYAFGDQHGLGAVASVGYHAKPLDVDITHTQPLSGNLDATTVFTTKYAFNDHVSLGLSDQINWRTGHTVALTLSSTLGSTNYQLGYDLPNSGGQGNRARFGVTTTKALNDHLSAGLRGSALYDLNAQTAELGAGADLNYKTERLSATTGGDLTYNTNTGFGVVLRAGMSGSLNHNLTLTADGLAEFGAGKNGQRFAVGYAYRSRNFNSLGTARYVNGTLAANKGELSSNLAAEYRPTPTLALRGLLDTRTLLQDPSSFTLQAGVSGKYYFTDYFGLGAWGRMITQPAAQTTQYGLGLEASLRALPGTWLSLGYNPIGFTGLTGNMYTKQGLYLRLDLTLDETLGGLK